MRLRQRTAGHRHRQLDVIRRIGRDEVDRTCFDRGQDGGRVADDQADARRIETALAAGIGGAEVSQDGPRAVALSDQVTNYVVVDRRPTWIELDPDRPAGAARDGGAEERPADACERVKDEVPGP